MSEETYACSQCDYGNAMLVVSGESARLRCHRCGYDDEVPGQPFFVHPLRGEP